MRKHNFILLFDPSERLTDCGLAVRVEQLISEAKAGGWPHMATISLIAWLFKEQGKTFPGANLDAWLGENLPATTNP